MHDGDDFFASLRKFCADNDVKYGYIPMFIGAFKHAKVVGTCRHADAGAPMLESYVDLDFVETFGAGTIAYDETQGRISPHVHLSLGERMRGATGSTSHLFDATVQFLVEMMVIEVVAPAMTRPPKPELFNLNLLQFG